MIYCAGCGRQITGTRFIRHEKLRFHPRCVPEGIFAVEPPTTISAWGLTLVPNSPAEIPDEPKPEKKEEDPS